MYPEISCPFGLLSRMKMMDIIFPFLFASSLSASASRKTEPFRSFPPLARTLHGEEKEEERREVGEGVRGSERREKRRKRRIGRGKGGEEGRRGDRKDK